MGKIIDKNDFWFIEKNPITKVGVYPYLGRQISQDCEPDKIYYVLRPKEELFRKETLDSLRLIPLIDGHTMIGKDFTAPEDKGLDGTLGDNVSHDTDTIYNDLKIISNKMKEEIQNGKKELSLGYFCRYDKQPGTYKGQRYDYVQRDIIANHLALVDKGRMGADVRVYDSKDIPEGEAFAMDSIDITMDKDEDIEWITVKGTHIPIKKGASEEQKSKTIEQFFKMKRVNNKENTDPFDNEEKRKKFEELNAELHGKKQSSGNKTEKQSGGEHKIGEKVGFKDYQGVEYKLTKKENGMLTFENIDDDSDKLEMSENSFNRQLKEKNAQKFGGEKEQKQPKDFKEGDMIHFKDTDKHYAYLGKDKKGMHVFADSEAYTEGRVDATDLWKMGDDYLKKNLENGRITAIENAWENESEKSKQTAESAKSEPEDNDREYRNKLFREATKRVEEKEKNKLQKEAEEIQKRQSKREDNENGSFKDKLFREATKKVEQKRMNEIQRKLEKQQPEEKGTKTEKGKNYDAIRKISKYANKNFTLLGKEKEGFNEFLNEVYYENLNDEDMTGNISDITWKAIKEFREYNEELEKSGQKKFGEDSMEYKTIQGEDEMADKKMKVAIDEDKRKIIDEIGGILKEAGLDDELIRTVIGKAEKIAYNKSEAGDEGEEVEKEVVNEEETEEGKDKKTAKDKCGKDEEKDEEAKKKEIVKEFAKKEKLAKEVEDALGTFDHAEMTELEVAKYACDKLELGAVEGQELATLKGYLKGIAKAPKTTFGYKRTVATDSGIQKEDAEFEKFANKGE